MPGANYMGGRRNAAKARSKDADAKAQRAHFARRRIFANSLAKPRENTYKSTTRNDAFQPIELAHARRRSVAESLPHATASNPSEGSGDIAGYLNNRESDILVPHVDEPPLKIRNQTNVTEAVNLRATMDHICSVPDLAGLANVRIHQKIMRDCMTGASRPSLPRTQEKCCSNQKKQAFPQRSAHIRSPSHSQEPEEKHSLSPPHSQLRDSSEQEPALSPQSLGNGPNAHPDNEHFHYSSDFEPMVFDDDNEMMASIQSNNYSPLVGSPPPATLFRRYVAPFEHSPGAGGSVGTGGYLPEENLEMLDNNPECYSSSIGSISRSATPIDSWSASPERGTQPLVYEPHESPSIGYRYSYPLDESVQGTPTPRLSPDEHPPSFPMALDDVMRCSSHDPSSAHSTLSYSPTPLVERTLDDILEGHIFEDADPWNTIKERLGLQSQTLKSNERECDDDHLRALRSAHDRSGVGYREITVDTDSKFHYQNSFEGSYTPKIKPLQLQENEDFSDATSDYAPSLLIDRIDLHQNLDEPTLAPDVPFSFLPPSYVPPLASPVTCDTSPCSDSDDYNMDNFPQPILAAPSVSTSTDMPHNVETSRTSILDALMHALGQGRTVLSGWISWERYFVLGVLWVLYLL